MPHIIDKAYTESHKEEIIAAIKNGAIFIYPTDTIYGIGCDATNEAAVWKLRDIKKRSDKPFSIVAPGKDWIFAHVMIPPAELKKLPGPVTLIVNWKEGNPLSQAVNPHEITIGIRIPDHWFSKIIEAAGLPFVTTSVNISGEKHMESLEDIPAEIRDAVDYIVYEGPKAGQSSEKIFLA